MEMRNKQKGKTTPSSYGKKQNVLLRKTMTKREYREFCQSYRCTLTLGRNYGTRTIRSTRDKERQKKYDWRHDNDE